MHLARSNVKLMLIRQCTFIRLIMKNPVTTRAELMNPILYEYKNDMYVSITSVSLTDRLPPLVIGMG